MDRRSDRNIGSFAWKCLPAVAAVVLAGCASPTPQDALYACPQVSIVRDLAEMTQFRPGGRDLTDITSRAALVDYSGSCDYTSDGVTVNMNLFLVAERGPALQGNSGSYQYFVAVARPDESLASKAVFDTTVQFPDGQPRAGSREELAPKIPLPVDVNAKDWKIFVGFQLTPEQLEFNRSQMQRQ